MAVAAPGTFRPLLIWATLAAFAADACPAFAQSESVEWDGVERVVAFADVHGADAELRTLLREAGVTDAADRWAAGNAHVVSLGDLLDRGAGSRQVLDLLMRLQDEARMAGGRLHVVLGNHEAMNLLGDLRYVDAQEYAGYADLESAAEREAARLAPIDGCSTPCPSFDERFPPGYFAHRAAFAPDGRYGRWLLGLPVAIRINDTLFMHGGLGPALRGVNLTDLNRRYRTALGEALEHPETAEDDPLLSQDGPNWYRGTALCHEATESDVLLPLLAQFGAARLVIGHTPTRDARAVTRFDGRVVKLDTGMNPVYRGRSTALMLSGQAVRVLYAGEAGAVEPQPESLFVAPQTLDDASVVAALREGEIEMSGAGGADELAVSVRRGDFRIPAVFRPRDSGGARREVAAFRLDRLLGLGIVPATVEREIEGRSGVLQARPTRWTTESARQQQPLTGGWCDLAPQFQLLYALDALTGNEQRTTDSILYDADEALLYATSFGGAFGTGRGLPRYLRTQPPTPGAELRRRLRLLEEPALAAALGELLDVRQRRAILARRDALSALPPAPEGSRP
jgi:hypothetical protein